MAKIKKTAHTKGWWRSIRFKSKGIWGNELSSHIQLEFNQKDWEILGQQLLLLPPFICLCIPPDCGFHAQHPFFSQSLNNCSLNGTQLQALGWARIDHNFLHVLKWGATWQWGWGRPIFQSPYHTPCPPIRGPQSPYTNNNCYHWLRASWVSALCQAI